MTEQNHKSAAIKESGRNLSPLSLYLHIPFCIQKCLYCDFLSAPAGEERRQDYVQALCREIKAAAQAEGDFRVGAKERVVDTVFIGGGTPSLLKPAQMEQIMEALSQSFLLLPEAEISMEANPGTVTEESLKAYRDLGINRLSLGVQSLVDEELSALGRIHTAAQARQAYEMARDAGFANINIDLMSALPGQTRESYEGTLEEVCRWQPEHISAYSLILEEETPFYTMDLDLPEEESERWMYHRTKELLHRHGYERYEISNYARRKDRETEGGSESGSLWLCRHNKGYWTGHNYLGLGLGSSSMVDHMRFCNTGELDDYVKNAGDPALLREQVHTLSLQEQMEEFMFLGLRLTKGVSEADFLQRFGQRIENIYGTVLAGHVKQGLLQREDGWIRLTDFGMDVSNRVMADYLLDG